MTGRDTLPLGEPGAFDLALGEASDEAAWREAVAKGLKGAAFESLVATTSDTLAIAPLYREPDMPTARDVSGFPGAAPFIRGPLREGAAAWTIRQCIDAADPYEANGVVLEDLAGGVASVELVIDRSGGAGIAVASAQDLDIALAGVMLEAAPIALDAGAQGLECAEWLAAKLKGAAGAATAYNIDPLGCAMRSGETGDLGAACAFAARMRGASPAATSLRVDARPVHEAGGAPAMEIAAALSAGIAYLRGLSDAGLGPAEASGALLFTMSIESDVLAECAKLRALRLCWARVMEAAGAARESRRARVQAVSSGRMMTRYDAWTNIVRVSTAGFAAAIGGADAITTLPFTHALGRASALARRIARNTQHILFEESHVGRVADPAGGAWFVEAHTRALAAAAWAHMQTIEAEGGFLNAVASGSLSNSVSQARMAQAALYARRKKTITGISDFPLIGQILPVFEPRTIEVRWAGGFSPMRWAAPFEDLRARGEASGARVFLANLGPLADFSARSAFACNLLAAGGITAIDPERQYETLEALLAAFRESGSRVAVLTGADAHYEKSAAPSARALKQAGCDWLALAGRPGGHEEVLRAAGVDQFVFAGEDALAALATLHAAFGIGA